MNRIRGGVIWCGLLLAFVFLSNGSAYGQFYYQGRGPASLKWMQLKANDYQLLYPSTFAPTAKGLSVFMDTISPYISYGMKDRPKRTPIILRTENMYSNGYVVWAPRRDEMVTAPPSSTFAVPWLKQLTVHEWRHVVQMSNMYHGMTKVLTWLLGEAGVGIGLLAVSNWVLEGDATLAETQFSEFGRGLQPSFNIEYRAWAAEDKLRVRRLDKWVCGSYKDNIPDIYKYGYQVMTAGETYYSPTLWGDILHYSAKWPILVAPDYFYLNKHYKTTVKLLTQRTFTELSEYWKSSFRETNNFKILTPTPGVYTQYQYPQTNPVDRGKVLALKSSFCMASHLVSIDTVDGSESRLRWLRGLSSRPVSEGKMLYWNEYKPHPVWEQESFSQVKAMNLATGRVESHHRWGRRFFVTPVSDGAQFVNSVLDDQSVNFLELSDSKFERLDTYNFPKPTTIHGLAWNQTSDELCFLAQDNRGMWLGAIEVRGTKLGDVRELRAPSLSSMANLSASGGRLYYESIASGKDEVHSLDVSSLQEVRMTRSKFGSGMPSVGDSTLWITSYTPKGYMVARGSVTDSVEQVQWSRLPKNTLNPPRYQWQVPKIDTIEIKPDATTSTKERRYRKGGRQFNVHSWAPLGFDGDYIESERNLKIAFGLTAFFQSTMSDMRGFATYGYVNGNHWLKGRFIYTGLPVQISVMAEYGGGKQLRYGRSSSDNSIADNHFAVNASLTLPLNFSGGGWFRTLNTTLNFTHYNARLYKTDGGYSSGLQRYSASVYWSENLPMTHQNLRPRFGYAFRASYSGNITPDFAAMTSLWGRGYFPGFAPNHSVVFEAAVAKQGRSKYLSYSKPLVLMGDVKNEAADKYAAFTVQYSLPLAYPDWGWDGVLYIKRIWANVYEGCSFGTYYRQKAAQTYMETRMDCSIGLDVSVNYNLFRAFEQQLTLSFAYPLNTKKLWFGVGFSMGF